MTAKYFLVGKQSADFLFDLDFVHTSEEPFVFDIQCREAFKQSPEAERSIRAHGSIQLQIDLGEDFIYEVLRLLLANGFTLVCMTGANSHQLNKNFQPIAYELRSPQETIEIGNFYISSIESAEELYSHFCRWNDLIKDCGSTDKIVTDYLKQGYFLWVKHDQGSKIINRS